MPGRRFCSNCFPYCGIFIVINFLLSHILFIATGTHLFTYSLRKIWTQKRRLFWSFVKKLSRRVGRVPAVLFLFQNYAGMNPISGVSITVYDFENFEFFMSDPVHGLDR